MAQFCSRCGQMLADNETCPCQGTSTARPNPQPYTQRYMETAMNSSVTQKAKPFVESMKDRMGIGEPELNKGDGYESGQKIIPDCVKANEGEIPVKQYTVATLRNRILGIPYSKAIGRMQVTNKRVIFRAPGKSIAGRSALQHEFAIDELAGIEARREYCFNIGDLLFGLVAMILGGVFSMGFIRIILSAVSGEGSYYAASFFLPLLIGSACCLPFFFLKKKFLLKVLCLSGALMPLSSYGSALWGRAKSSDLAGLLYILGGLLLLASLLVLAMTLLSLFLHTIKPNLVLIIKTKSASEAIDIRRRRFNLYNGKDGEHTGYNEVIPAEDAERCIREINAMINDIQKLGDFGIEKWKE